ncbi:hypothetical protein [Streptomyces viridosporus]|uniref:hypothetical protein n=1 Tax=Streptomyces viridosporus TaxID=67581 RepID=UPI0036FA952F
MKEMLSAFQGYFKVTLYVFFIATSMWAAIEQTVSLTLMAFILSVLCGTPSFTSIIHEIRLAKYQVTKYFRSRRIVRETVRKGSGSIPDSI